MDRGTPLMRRSPSLDLGIAERKVLESWVGNPQRDSRRRLRARIVLLCAEGRTNAEIARTLGTRSETVSRWRRRFLVNRIDGIARTGPRPHARRVGSPEMLSRILELTLRGPPQGGCWSTRSLGRALGVSHMLVHRVWQMYRIPGGGLRGSSPLSSAPEPPRGVDLLGVYTRDGWKAFVFGVGSNLSFLRLPLSDLDGARWRISGAYHGRDPRALCALTLQVLERAVGRASSPDRGLDRDFPGFLLFLERIERTTPGAGTLYLIHDALPPVETRKLEHWIPSHPRLAPFRTPPGESALITVERLLHLWSIHPELKLELRNVGLLRQSYEARPDVEGPPTLLAWSPWKGSQAPLSVGLPL